MRTVRSMIEELQKFPPNALCYAYEGEVIGLVIEHADRSRQGQGVIYCSESDRLEPDSDLLPGAEK